MPGESSSPVEQSTGAAPAPITLKRASLSLNAFALVAGNLALFGAVFLLTPLAIRYLGAEGWGIWQLVGATATYAQLLNLSLATALHYEVAVRTASGDWGGLAVAFTNVRLYLLLAGLLLLLLLVLAGRPFVEHLVEPQHVELAWLTLVVTIVLTAFDLQTRFFGSTLAGIQRVDIYGLFQVLGAGLLFAVVWRGLPAGMGLPGFAAAMTLGSSFAALLCWLPARRLLPRECFRLRRPDWGLFRRMIEYSLSATIYTAGTVVLYQTMKYIAALRCGGSEAAGHMGLAISLAQTLSVIFGPGVMSLMARVGQLKGETRLGEVPALLERVFPVLGLLLVPSVVFLWLDTRLIFQAWVGAELDGATIASLTSTTQLLLLGHAAYIAALPFYNAMLGIGEHRVFGIGMLAVAIANSVLCWLAAGWWPRVETLALLYSVSMFALVAFVTLPAGLARFPVSLSRVLARALGIPLLVSLVPVGGVLLRPRFGTPLADLALDALLFSALCLPGLELARRHLGIPLRLRM